MTSTEILVQTLDRYHAVWQGFCHGIRTYWPDCPWIIRATTNCMDFPCGDGLRVGGDRDWAENMSAALAKIEAPTLLVLLDDTWLTGPVDTNILLDFSGHVTEGRADHIHMITARAGDAVGVASFDNRLLLRSPDARYRAALSAGFWRKNVLAELLPNSSSIWDFERSEGAEDVRSYCVRKKGLPYMPRVFPARGHRQWRWTPVRRGRWTDDARRYARKEGLDIDFSKEPGCT